MTVTLTDKQKSAIDDLKNWFRNRTGEQQVFSVLGYAGAGKSTMVKYALAELGVDPHQAAGSSGFLAATFTGKAALVMSRKGTPAQTIHSLIYRVSDASPQEIERIKTEIAEIKTRIAKLGLAERLFVEAQLRSLELRLKDAHKPQFVLNTESVLRDARLLVLDEVSMVGRELAKDLLAFGKPILVLGDPGQLPPIKGEGAFNTDTPDVLLTEVHRQAAESAIIRLATAAREGTSIAYGEHDKFVWKMRRNEVGVGGLLNADQVLCGKNATRIWLNNAMKHRRGFANAYPTGEGEKIICLKNRNDLGVVNGMFLELTDIDNEDRDPLSFSAYIATEDGVKVGGDANSNRLRIYKGHFDDHIERDPERLERDHHHRRNLIEATWGWAITTHRAQGSQYQNVIVVDDGWGANDTDRRRWLYTAITRAERGLVLLD
jgi:exodeoxyribonuclease-5